MAQYETPHWTGPPPRPERDVRSDLVAWFAKYAFLFLLLFFVGLVVAAVAFLPALRGNESGLPELGGESPGYGEAPIAGIDPSREGVTLLNISTSPAGAVVQIDVDSVGLTPLYRRPLDKKVHLVSIAKPGFVRIDTLLFADDFRRDTTSLFFVLTPRLGAPTSTPLIADEDLDDGGRTPALDDRVERSRSDPVSEEASRNRTSAQEAPSRPAIDRVAAPEILFGSLNVTSDPSGAAVAVDGRIVGSTPLVMSDLLPGDREIALMLDGYKTENSVVNIQAGVRSDVQSTLSAASGTLVVLAKPYGTIFVDGDFKRRDYDVEYRVMLPVGPHIVSVSHPVLGQLIHTVVIEGNETSLIFDFNSLTVVSR